EGEGAASLDQDRGGQSPPVGSPDTQTACRAHGVHLEGPGATAVGMLIDDDGAPVPGPVRSESDQESRAAVVSGREIEDLDILDRLVRGVPLDVQSSPGPGTRGVAEGRAAARD